MRISDWSSDVCSSDLPRTPYARRGRIAEERPGGPAYRARAHRAARSGDGRGLWQPDAAEPGRIGQRARTEHVVGAGVGQVERRPGRQGDPLGGARPQPDRRWPDRAEGNTYELP